MFNHIKLELICIKDPLWKKLKQYKKPKKNIINIWWEKNWGIESLSQIRKMKQLVEKITNKMKKALYKDETYHPQHMKRCTKH